MDPAVASDGIDEMLDVFVGLTRVLFEAPGDRRVRPPPLHRHRRRVADHLPAPGERVVIREHAKGDVAFRGPAESLLLFLWGRDGGRIETVGDQAVADRWRELVPPM